MSVSLGGFGAAVHRLPVAAARAARFGSTITVGKVDDVLARHPGQRRLLLPRRGPGLDHRVPGRRASPKAEAVYPPNVRRAACGRGSSPSTRSAPTSAAVCPSAQSSQWFECPCHGSQYNRVGEKKGGPAPRGMDHFALTVAGGNVIVDTGTSRPRRRHRHEHHRPGGRGSPLHRPVVTDGPVPPPRRRSRRDHRRRPDRRLAGLPVVPTSATPEPRPGAEIELAPNRKPYYSDEELEGPKLERTQIFGVAHARRHRRRAPPVLAHRARPPGRRHERLQQALRQLGLGGLRPDGRGRLQLRRLPRRHAGHRWRGALHHHRPEHRRGRLR